MIPGVARDCTHPRAQHPHGHYLRARRDGCGCTPCLDAARRHDKRTRINTEHGTSSYVDAAPARAHVELLLTDLTIGQIEARSGLNRMSLYALLGRSGRKPSRRITRKTEQALLAITPRRVDPRDHGILVDPTGTTRRLQALMALGWPGAHLVERLGWSHRTLWVLTASPGPIRAATRDDVLELYRELSSQTPEPSKWVTLRRRLSRERGWAPPAAWDDDEIDEPGATPYGHEPEPVRRTDRSAHAVELVEDLLDVDPGIRMGAAAARLGRTVDTLQAQLRRAGRTDLTARLCRSFDGAALYRTAS